MPARTPLPLPLFGPVPTQVAVFTPPANYPPLASAIPAYMRMLSRKQVCAIIGFSDQHIRRLEKKGEFPVRIRIGKNRVRWYESVILEYIDLRRRGITWSERPGQLPPPIPSAPPLIPATA